MSRRIPVRRKVIAVLGGLFVFVLALGALAGCSSSGNGGGGNAPNASNVPNTSNPPNTTAQPVGETTTAGEATSSNVVVRVSGAQGVAYSGTYGTSQDVRVVDGIVGAEPTDYDVQGGVDVVTATFKKTQPGGETLKVSILNGGEVVTESETSAEFGSVTVNWSQQEGSQGRGTTLPGGFGSDRSQ